MKLLLPALYFFALLLSHGGEVLDRQFAALAKIRTVSCEAERITVGPPGELRMLSRVFYQADRMLHSENIKPAHRRIILDGKSLFLKDDAFPKGFSAPLADLDQQDAWRDQLRRIPGTPSEHLHRIRGAGGTELKLEAADKDGLMVAIPKPGSLCPVLHVDELGRLTRIEYFRDETRALRTAVMDYSDFKEFDGVWLSQTQKAILTIGADTVTETARFLNLQVNQSLAASLFDPAVHFKGVVFADKFDQMK
jgi:hypothetical protein